MGVLSKQYGVLVRWLPDWLELYACQLGLLEGFLNFGGENAPLELETLGILHLHNLILCWQYLLSGELLPGDRLRPFLSQGHPFSFCATCDSDMGVAEDPLLPHPSLYGRHLGTPLPLVPPPYRSAAFGVC